MIEILKFVFQDFWHYLGMLIILTVIAEGIGRIFRR